MLFKDLSQRAQRIKNRVKEKNIEKKLPQSTQRKDIEHRCSGLTQIKKKDRVKEKKIKKSF